MSAVTGGVEQDEDTEGSLAGLGAARQEPRALAAMHKGLTQNHWIRSALSWYLQKVRVRHEWDGHELLIVVTDAPVKDAEGPYIPKNAVPWSQMAFPIRSVKAWSYLNKKMDCPSFDLPTGAASVGGSCPGAVEGQTIVPNRKGVLSVNGQPVDLAKTICNACYVTAGPFGYTSNQLAQMLRHIWVAGMLNHSYEGFVSVMTESILAMPEQLFPRNAPGDILPIRIHSAGDFFDFRYASAWLDICNRVGDDPKGRRFRFWAPTRTWVVRGWPEWWRSNLPRLTHDNLLVRASAFHFDDPAPGALDGKPARSTTTGMGSTSMFNTGRGRSAEDFKAKGGQQRFYDWTCPTFADVGGSCTTSVNPTGSKHCRACWVRPDLRVQYPAH